MIGKDDNSTSNGVNEEQGTVPRYGYHLSPHARILVEQRDGGFDYDADVTPSEVERIAKLGQIPNDQLKTLAQWLRITLAYQALIQDQKASRHFTRRQLLDALSKLASPGDGHDRLDVPPWLITELIRIEAHRLIDSRLGSQTRIDFSEEELQRLLETGAQAFKQAEKRVRDSLKDTNALGELARNAHSAVSANSETGEEYLAKKRALRPEKTAIANEIIRFWTERLKRPSKVTNVMIYFAEAVYKLCGIEMTVPAVKRQLYESIKQRGTPT